MAPGANQDDDASGKGAEASDDGTDSLARFERSTAVTT